MLIHPISSTSVYRKLTNTNLYTHYSSASTKASKESVVRSLTRRAVKLYFPRHLKMELKHLEATFLSNGYPLQKIRHLMSQTIERTKSTAKPRKSTSSSTDVPTLSIPYYKSFVSSLKKSLARYNIFTTFGRGITLKSTLSHKKFSVPPEKQKNLIYKIPCHDCEDFYISQTSRSLVKRIKEHEVCYRLNNYTDSSTGNINSSPAKHARENGHVIDWKKASILTTCDHKSQLNLPEHAAIINLAPYMSARRFKQLIRKLLISPNKLYPE